MNPQFPLFPGAGRFRGRKIGLLGGSFNPAHNGHVNISRVAIRRLALDEVWWLVSPQNPLKSTSGMAAVADRVDYARKLAKHRNIRVLDIESRLGTRYTVDTVTALHRVTRADFVWLMGADNLAQLPHWKDWVKLMRSIPIAILDRPGYSYCGLAGQGAQRFSKYRVLERASRTLSGRRAPAWVFLHCARDPASATGLRTQGGRQVRNAIANEE